MTAVRLAVRALPTGILAHGFVLRVWVVALGVVVRACFVSYCLAKLRFIWHHEWPGLEYHVAQCEVGKFAASRELDALPHVVEEGLGRVLRNGEVTAALRAKPLDEVDKPAVL